MSSPPTPAERAAARAVARSARLDRSAERCCCCGAWTLIGRACGACGSSADERAESAARLSARAQQAQRQGA